MLKKKDMTFFEIKTARDIDAAYDVLTLFHRDAKEKVPSRAVQAACTKRAQKFGYKYLGCKVDGDVVAVAGLRLMPDPYGPQLYAYINNFVVAKNKRTLGIGSALLDYCIKIAKQHKVQSIALEVDKKNKAARNLYKFAGFEDYSLTMLRTVV